MERDFMGLSAKEPLAVVKEEITDAPLDSGVPWSFVSKVSALPHIMSFKTGQEDRTKKMADGFDSSQISSAAEVQSLRHLGVPDQTITFPTSNTSFKSNLASTGQNLMGGAALKQQYLGFPMTPSLGSIVGITEPWSNFKASTGPCQMTIFYAGSVCVYDDISPEKAQAIMLLAGNGMTPHQRPPQVQATATNLATTDPLASQSSPGHANHSSVPSHNAMQSRNASSTNDDTLGAKSVSVVPGSKPEPRMVNALTQNNMKTVVQSAVPQARKASLARFLEKRKERVISAAPYTCDRKSSDVANNDSTSLSATSAVNSASPPSSGKEKGICC